MDLELVPGTGVCLFSFFF